MLFDYETYKLIWWCFVGVLLVGFALTDGFDFGVGALLPFVGRNDTERRVVINSIGATWEGNQTWLVTAGGAIFAAWPLVYAAAFSGFYVAMLLCLSLGIMGVLTPFATGPSPVYYGSGYLPAKDYWRLGAIFGALFIAVMLITAVPWLAMIR